MNLTAEQLDILRHMLGINDPAVRNPKPYRNYYCANRDDKQLSEMSRIGAVRLYSQHGSYDWYCCTDAGRSAAIASHRIIRYNKAKRKYIRFLEVRDCCPDLSFRQFLTEPDFEEIRRNA